MQTNLDTNMKPANSTDYGDAYIGDELRNVVKILRRVCENPKVTITPLSEYGEINLFIEGVNRKSLEKVWYANALYDSMTETPAGMYILFRPDANVCEAPYIKLTEEDFDTNSRTSHGYTLAQKGDGTYEITKTLEQTEYGVVVQNG